MSRREGPVQLDLKDDQHHRDTDDRGRDEGEHARWKKEQQRRTPDCPNRGRGGQEQHSCEVVPGTRDHARSLGRDPDNSGHCWA
jgi:hypothetical protein